MYYLITMANTKRLSKTAYMAGRQCEKYLWFYTHKYALKEEPDLAWQHIMDMGTWTGTLVRGLFPGGTLVDFPYFKTAEAVAATSKFIKAGSRTLFEAAVMTGRLYNRADILIKNGSKPKYWDLHEVKASGGVKPEYLQDTAFQKMCLAEAGLKIADVHVVHLDKTYERKGKLDLWKLFKKSPVNDEIQELEQETKAAVRRFLEVIDSPSKPRIKPGPHCEKPHLCPFYDQCNKPGARPRSNPVIDHARLKECLAGLDWPMAFLDFETVSPAVPEFDNSRPFEKIPFQASLHVQRGPGGKLDHFKWLAKDKNDPRQEMADFLAKHLPSAGTIVAYNAPCLEVPVLKLLAEKTSGHKAFLDKAIPRVWDLLGVFRGGIYRDPAFNNSNSLKSVLPVIAPGLTYQGMNVKNGADASAIYHRYLLGWDNEEAWAGYREDLLKYCEMDTRGAAVIVETLLKEAAKNG